MAWQTRATTILGQISEDLQCNHTISKPELARHCQARKNVDQEVHSKYLKANLTESRVFKEEPDWIKMTSTMIG